MWRHAGVCAYIRHTYVVYAACIRDIYGICTACQRHRRHVYGIYMAYTVCIRHASGIYTWCAQHACGIYSSYILTHNHVRTSHTCERHISHSIYPSHVPHAQPAPPPHVYAPAPPPRAHTCHMQQRCLATSSGTNSSRTHTHTSRTSRAAAAGGKRNSHS